MKQQNKKYRIMLVCGEASGDMLGGELARALLANRSDCELFGVGGSEMKKAGVKLMQDFNTLTAFGVFGLIQHIPRLYLQLKKLTRLLKSNKPDLLITIDFSGFNLQLAKRAKKWGIKTMHYVSPQIWAWRYYRVNNIRKVIDHIAVLLPFEKPIYDKENISATYVGHPLAKMKPSMSKEQALHFFNLNSEKPIIALLVGSRLSEIKRICPVIIKAAKLIKEQLPDAQFILPLAPNLTPKLIQPYLSNNIRVIENNTNNAVQCASAAICVSGTMTLQTALLNVPLVITYIVSPLNAWLAKRVLKIKYVGLCNLMVNQEIAKELLQENATPDHLATETLKLIQDQTYRADAFKKLATVKVAIGNEDGALNAANVAISLLN